MAYRHRRRDACWPTAGPAIQEEPAISSILAIPLLIWAVAFGLAAAWSAAQLGRARVLWFVFGTILGPIALLLLRVAPPALCRTCGSLTRGWLTTCWWCRQSVYGVLSEPIRAVGSISTGPASQATPMSETTRRSGPQRSLRERLEAALASDVAAPPTGPTRVVPARTVAPSAGQAPQSIRTRRSPRSAAPTGPALAAARSPSSDASRDGLGEGRRDRTGPAATSGSRGAPSSAEPRLADDTTGTLATAVYVAGSTSLQSGHRFGIAVRESRLQILGPTEVDPQHVALDRPLAGLDARSVEGRLIIADGHGLVLAFMAVAGPSPRDLATTISAAAREAGDR